MEFNIAGISLRLTGKNDYLTERSKAFAQSDTIKGIHASPDIEIDFEFMDEIPVPEGEEIIRDNTVWLTKKEPEKGYYIYIPDGKGNTTMTLMDTSEDWSKVKIHSVKSDLILSKVAANPVKWNDYHTFLFAGIAFRNRLIKMNGIMIHSSSIEYGGRGLMFSAPSGTGKSTHARMWKELYGDAVTYINDDRPAIRFLNDKAMICGIPWSGTSDLFSNKIIPLGGIIMLEQAPANKIAMLSANEALQMLMPRCFLPYYDRGMMAKAMDMLEKIIRDIPVFHLKCRPDYEAVEIVRKCVS